MVHGKWLNGTLIIVLLFCACVNSIDEESEDVQQVKRIELSAVPYQVELVATRATADYVKRLAWLVVDSKGCIVMKQEKTSESTDFDKATLELPYGSYRLYLVGHNGGEDVSISADGIATFAETKLTDTFSKCMELTVGRETEGTLSIPMQRTVAKFILKCKDAIPAEVSRVTLCYTGAGQTLDVKTGLTADTDLTVVQERNITIPSSNKGKTDCSFVAYMFLPSEESTIYLTATSWDSEDNPVSQYTFTAAPMQQNCQTTYTGQFFSNGESISGGVTIDGTWGSGSEFEF